MNTINNLCIYLIDNGIDNFEVKEYVDSEQEVYPDTKVLESTLRINLQMSGKEIEIYQSCIELVYKKRVVQDIKDEYAIIINGTEYGSDAPLNKEEDQYLDRVLKLIFDFSQSSSE